MTSTFQLNLPVDIPWQRICVSEDMIDRVVCDDRMPPKWQSSLAVFKYTPDEDYQLYADYDISYLKVTATITGYQAQADEIQGDLDWSGLNTTTIEGVKELLSKYFPCTGAILQVVVGPHARDEVPLGKYPFFMDFEPKKRELYEMATDTRERQSRSSEALQVGKSAGNTQSQEVLDVDMGGSAAVGSEFTYAGTGGGFNVSASNQGQWGTKAMGTQQSQTDRRSDVSRELREGSSFTTQISQMYHQLDSYHLGTNRAVFFVQPRPHVLEEPSGFVQGPRKVEGIQEFFLVVAQPKETPEYCVSVRLDTAHLAETDVAGYETRVDITDLAQASARIPTDKDQPGVPALQALGRACIGPSCWGVRYYVYVTHAEDDVAYKAPDGFTITGRSDLVNSVSHGSSSVTVAPGAKNLNIHVEADGHIGLEAGLDVCLDCADEVEKWAGSARRQLQVELRSDEETVKTGTQLRLLVTTRGVCCCPDGPKHGKGVVAEIDVPSELGGMRAWGPQAMSHADHGAQADHDAHLCAECAEAAGGAPPPAAAAPGMTIRQANALGDFIKERLVGAQRDPAAFAEPVPFVFSDLFNRQVELMSRRSRGGRETLGQPAHEAIPPALAESVAKRLGVPQRELTVRDVLAFRPVDLQMLSGLERAEVAEARLNLLGAQIVRPEAEAAAKRA